MSKNPIGYCRDCGGLRIYEAGRRCEKCGVVLPGDIPRAGWQLRNDGLAAQAVMRQRAEFERSQMMGQPNYGTFLGLDSGLRSMFGGW